MRAARIAILAPDFFKGVHAAVATIVPFYLVYVLHEPRLAWVALGGWLGSLADPGGALRKRAATLLAFIVVASTAVVLGQVAAANYATAPLAFAAIVFAASLAPALGSTAGTIGTLTAIVATVASARHGSPMNGLWFAAGAAWSAVSAALMWPILPHQPLRHATGRVFDRLADYLDAIAEEGPHDWPELARTHQRAVRAAIEQARETAVALRARRSGESPVGANLRVVLGAAENMFFRVIAVAEKVERGGTVPPEIAEAFRSIAVALYTRRAPREIDLSGGNTPLFELTRSVVNVLRDIDHSHVDPLPRHREGHKSLRDLRDALSPRGPIFIHAVRVAILAAVSLTIGRAVSPAHPTWVPVTAIAVLQPYLGATLVRAAERVIGTVLGALIALVIVVVVRDPLAVSILLFPLSVAAVMTKPRSYRLFVLFLTPVFVVITDIKGADWHSAATRTLDVLAGGVLAFIAAMIAPSHERPRLADALGGVVDALRRYAELATGEQPREAVVTARRNVGIALERAEASLERMLAEPAPLRRGAESAMYIVTYGRRLSTSITALLETGVAIPANVTAYVIAVLDEMRARLDGRPGILADQPPQVSPQLTPLVQRAELLRSVRD